MSLDDRVTAEKGDLGQGSRLMNSRRQIHRNSPSVVTDETNGEALLTPSRDDLINHYNILTPTSSPPVAKFQRRVQPEDEDEKRTAMMNDISL